MGVMVAVTSACFAAEGKAYQPLLARQRDFDGRSDAVEVKLPDEVTVRVFRKRGSDYQPFKVTLSLSQIEQEPITLMETSGDASTPIVRYWGE
ncbi:MAG: hypothetical protein V2A58_01165 [Planctomycetota bacterium]